ncbi:hypothetical protein ACFL6K_01165 [Candidatus Latescibacterota bacterium]
MDANDKKLKKIKILSILCLFLILFESVIGVGMLYTGFIYRQFDKKNAQEMLDIIQYTDKNYYDKLMDNTDPSYMQEFQQIHTLKGNTVLKASGLIVIIISALCMMPMLLMINVVFNKPKKETDKEEDKKKERPKVEEAK